MENYEFPDGKPSDADAGSAPPGLPPQSPGRPASSRATTVRMAAAPPPQRSRGRGWMWFALFLMLVLGLSLFCNLALVSSILSPGSGASLGARNDNLQEIVLEDGGSEKVAVIEVLGMISSYSYDGTGKSMVDYVEAMLERAANDPDVRAVLLKVDSPGGEVLASDDIYKAIKEFQAVHRKPVVGVMEGLAASGGYYVSAPCQWIVANELTMTGSIGVIMQGFNFRGLMDKVGVEPLTFKSGKMKDMLSSTKPISEISAEERKIVQEFIDETYDRFKSIVREGREMALNRNPDSRALVEGWERYADGRLLSGKQAHEHGFIDELGGFEDAVSRAESLAGIKGATLVVYRKVINIGSLFRLLGKSEAKTTVKLDLGVDLPKLRAGRAYFLPASMAY